MLCISADQIDITDPPYRQEKLDELYFWDVLYFSWERKFSVGVKYLLRLRPQYLFNGYFITEKRHWWSTLEKNW